MVESRWTFCPPKEMQPFAGGGFAGEVHGNRSFGILVRMMLSFHLPAQGDDKEIKSQLCFSSLYNSHSFESKAKIRSRSPPLFQVHPEVQVFGYDLTYPHLETCHSMDKSKLFLVPPPNTLFIIHKCNRQFF